MKSGWHIGKLRQGRLVRVVALLFLFHAGVDLLFPQLCSEEPVNIAFQQSFPVCGETPNDETSVLVAVSLPTDSGEDRPTDPTREEDCFCCCTHVMASPGFVNPNNAELKLPTHSQPNSSILSAPPNNPYHPPRFA
ncbi:MAG TPA: hypothetical protein VN643_00200 [Pyrinomonadaceae bacterium]|nr:hypothetical protein [Pyrinomonadaceae bacterium]